MTFKKGNICAWFGRVCGLAWPILGRLGRLDPSSNLGRPTILNEVMLIYFVIIGVAWLAVGM